MPSTGGARPRENFLERRATQLESAILSKYATTEGAFRDIDITELVHPSISPPADFHDTENLLKMAGFAVDFDGAAPPNLAAHLRLPTPWYAILPPAYDVYIFMDTNVPGRPSRITTVRASIARSDL